MTTYIGTSGWYYEHWNEVFYPADLESTKRLHHYAAAFSTVEINTTFYHLPKQKSVENWFQQVDDDFIFSIKASQYITHRKRLKDSKTSTKKFLNSIKYLGKKIGPILFQLPPSFKCDINRLDSFLSVLPQEHRYTFEFRHPTWFIPEVCERLKQYDCALCITDLGGHLSPIEITTDFTYIRLHGPQRRYKGTYGKARLKQWKEFIQQNEKKSITTFCYFDNDEKGYAVQDAITLKQMLEPRKKQGITR